jgi:hypothetical protein
MQQQLGISPMKAIWINETNARPSMDPEWPVQVQAFHLDLDQQAWYVPQALALGFYAGAERIAIYKLVDINMNPGDESWGLIRPYDFSKRPAFYSYKNSIKYLAGFQYPIRREQSGNHYIFAFSRPQGTTRVMWARNQAAVTLKVAALADSGILVDPVTGAETPVTAVNGFYDVTLQGARCHGECLLGGPPVFLVENVVAEGAAPPSQPVSVAAPTATLTATATISATATLTPTAVPTETNTPRPTRTPSPTNTPTVAPTDTAVPTETAAAAAEVAMVAPTALPPAQIPAAASADEKILGVVPVEQASFWFIGTAVLLLVVVGIFYVRSRQKV